MSPIEKRIASKLVDRILAKNLLISVHDGEDFPIVRCSDKAKIMDALASTDMDTIVIRDHDKNKLGWITLVWGNEEDLISDHLDNELCDELTKNIFPL